MLPHPVTSKFILRPAANELAVIVTLFVFCWLAADFRYGSLETWRPGTDSGIFLGTALHLSQGYWLYEEIFDNKPPIIFLLNMLALNIGGDGWHSVRQMELGSMALTCYFLYRIALAIDIRRLIAMGGGLLFALVAFQRRLIEGGNTSEQYGLMFMMAGAWLLVVTLQTDKAGPLWRPLLGGLALGLSPITKEPFLLPAAAWLLLGALALIASGRRKEALALAIGFAAPGLCWIAIYVTTGRLPFLLDYLSFNLGYVQKSSVTQPTDDRWLLNLREAYYRLYSYSRLVNVLAFLGLTSCVLAVIKGSSRRFICFAVLCVAAADFAATGISQFRFGHYYVQAAGSFFILALIGTADACTWAAHTKLKLYLSLGALVALVAVDEPFLSESVARLKAGPEAPAVSVMAAHMRQNAEPAAKAWIASNKWSYLYIESGLTSPTRYAFVADLILVDSHTGSAADKLTEVERSLKSNPPQFIVWAEQPDNIVFRTSHIGDWVRSAYQDTGLTEKNSFGVARLLARSDIKGSVSRLAIQPADRKEPKGK